MSLATWVMIYGVLAWLAACVAILAVAGAVAWAVAWLHERFIAERDSDGVAALVREKRKTKG